MIGDGLISIHELKNYFKNKTRLSNAKGFDYSIEVHLNQTIYSTIDDVISIYPMYL